VTSTPPEQPEDDLARDLLRRTTGSRRRGTPQRRRGKWPGEPIYSGADGDERDPVTASDAVEQLLDVQGWRSHTQVAAAMARWQQIAGPELAAHVTADSFVDGVLTLRADSTTWATQMRLLLPTVRQAIDAAVGIGVVADIRIEGPRPPKTRGLWRVPGRGPRDTYG